MVADVHDERRRRAVIDEVITHPFRFPRLAFRFVLPESRVERRLGQDLAGGGMVGMSIGPVRDCHRAWPMTPDERDSLLQVSRIFSDSAIGPVEIVAPDGIKHEARRLGLGQPLLDRAVAPQLASRQIAQSDALSGCRVARDGAGKADLDVVGVRAEGE
jgi:hypothetical protein